MVRAGNIKLMGSTSAGSSLGSARVFVLGHGVKIKKNDSWTQLHTSSMAQPSTKDADLAVLRERIGTEIDWDSLCIN